MHMLTVYQLDKNVLGEDSSTVQNIAKATGETPKTDYLLGGGPLVVQASSARLVF